MSIPTVGELIIALMEYDPKLPVLKNDGYGYEGVQVIEGMLYRVRRCDNDELDNYFLDADHPGAIGETFPAVVL
jgi:hypothetical protein